MKGNGKVSLFLYSGLFFSSSVSETVDICVHVLHGPIKFYVKAKMKAIGPVKDRVKNYEDSRSGLGDKKEFETLDLCHQHFRGVHVYLNTLSNLHDGRTFHIT